jgi:heme/copper-type cytochrome/quinol oxidase subunit 4
MHGGGLSTALRRGILAIAILTVLTVVEYIVPVVMDSGSTPYMVAFAIAKTAVILHYFMHITHLWREEE